MKKKLALYIIMGLTYYTQNNALSLTKTQTENFYLIDKLRKTQTYCQEELQKPHYLKRILGTATEHTNTLKKNIADIQHTIEELATLSTYTTLEHYHLQETQEKAQALLEIHTPQHHVIRNWKKYSIAIIAAFYALFKIDQKMRRETIFAISGPSVGDALYSEVEHNRFHYTYDKQHPEQQYLRIENQDRAQFKEFLDQQHTLAYQEQKPTLSDFKRMPYDRYGNNIIKEFFNNSLIEPIKHIKRILFKEHSNERMLVHDIEHGTKKFEEHLDTLITKALTLEETRPLVEHYTQTIPLEQLSFGTKRTILQDILGYAQQHVPEKFEALKSFNVPQASSRIPYKNEFDGIIKGVHSALSTLADLAQNDTTFLSLTTQAAFLHALERDLQLAILMNKIHNISDKLNLNFEIMATIPAGLVSYGTYKGIVHLATRQTTKKINELKKELVIFKLFLNKHRYTQANDTIIMCNGMCLYWQNKISMFKKWIPSSKHALFDTHLKEITDAPTFEQKFAVVDSLYNLVAS